MATAAQQYLRTQPRSAHTFVLTIPDTGFPLPPAALATYVGTRRAVNDFILTRGSNAAPDGWRAVDIERLVPYAGHPTLWSDHLHFSSAGYDRVGEHVFEAIQPVLAGLVPRL